MKHTPRARATRGRPRGQAMVEYSILNAVLVVALLLATQVRLDWGGGQARSVIELFLEAYQSYHDSYHFVLNLPIP